jgi:hypothetical protein
MGHVAFEVVHQFQAPARVVWDELIDWKAHEQWVPMTRVEVGPGDPHQVGATFTAWTGPWKLALKDMMRVVTLDWIEDDQHGHCEVDKLGPVLKGRAGFTVRPSGSGSEVAWVEDVTVPYVPRILTPIVAKLGAAGFRLGMKKLAKLTATTAAQPT